MVFGMRLFGKVDRLSNGWFIATKFGHLNYFPLVPAGSMLVMQYDGRTWRGVPVALSVRSMAMAWARAIAFACATVAAIIACVISFGRHPGPTETTVCIGVAIALLALFIGTLFLWRKASPEREAALLRSIEARVISGKLPPARGFDVLPSTASAQTTAAAANASPPPLPLADSKGPIPLAKAP